MEKNAIAGLRLKDDRVARALEDRIVSESLETDKWYRHFDGFAALLDHPEPSVRGRALRVLAAIAQWDDENRLEALLPAFLPRAADEDPAAAAERIRLLAQIGVARPRYIPKIRSALKNAGLSEYRGGTRALMEKEIAAALAVLKDREEYGCMLRDL